MVNMNRRVIIMECKGIRNDQGGLVNTVVRSWVKWAKIEDRTGSNGVTQNKTQWEYDYKITMRYYPSIPTKSNYYIVYEGVAMKIENISINNEGFKKFEVARCSKVDEQITVIESSLIITEEGDNIITEIGENIIIE
jgi:SPP1 family predicted phage head-tail adaptor